MYLDAHVHLHEDPSMKKEIPIIIAVSDDLESSRKTLEIAENPCIGERRRSERVGKVAGEGYLYRGSGPRP